MQIAQSHSIDSDYVLHQSMFNNLIEDLQNQCLCQAFTSILNKQYEPKDHQIEDGEPIDDDDEFESVDEELLLAQKVKEFYGESLNQIELKKKQILLLKEELIELQTKLDSSSLEQLVQSRDLVKSQIQEILKQLEQIKIEILDKVQKHYSKLFKNKENEKNITVIENTQRQTNEVELYYDKIYQYFLKIAKTNQTTIKNETNRIHQLKDFIMKYEQQSKLPHQQIKRENSIINNEKNVLNQADWFINSFEEFQSASIKQSQERKLKNDQLTEQLLLLEEGYQTLNDEKQEIIKQQQQSEFKEIRMNSQISEIQQKIKDLRNVIKNQSIEIDQKNEQNDPIIQKLNEQDKQINELIAKQQKLRPVKNSYVSQLAKLPTLVLVVLLFYVNWIKYYY